MHQHDRVVVDVDDPGGRVDRLDDLVDVGAGRDAGADVEELSDPQLPGKEAHGPAHEAAVLQDADADAWEHGRDRLPGLAVGGEVVLAAKPVVVSAGRMGHRRVDLRRKPTRIVLDRPETAVRHATPPAGAPRWSTATTQLRAHVIRSRTAAPAPLPAAGQAAGRMHQAAMASGPVPDDTREGVVALRRPRAGWSLDL